MMYEDVALKNLAPLFLEPKLTIVALLMSVYSDCSKGWRLGLNCRNFDESQMSI